MPFSIRKIVVYKEATFIEGDKALATPVTLVGVAAVIRNPWFGRGFVEDLSPEQRDGCGELGKVMVARMLEEIGGKQAIEAYGKSAVVGGGGEIEHASAVIHNLRFGNHYRHAVEAESFLSFTNKRGGLNTSLQVPIKHIHDGAARSHFITLEFAIPDAPNPDEIVIVLGASTAGRPHARIGDRHQDMQEIERENAAH
ncbi:amino acid synthesis family protein [Paraburkholderia sp. Ac-20336]|uniref:amino acid synthesis family protein n=1 Tax=Burkholderiaceae TaxID=119060 RepID=UPI0014238DFF|nr:MULTISPECIES: amino acid synthesis family protein [Burkholderiaceae]MBN3801700.1 amino acid synthesis family protein [Paraburkholderia sp. Ac-20336]MBN3845646.1 amino acid synthesis family protein [Paraburkholderia sp. Ac-20342]NIF51084.1 amino acid synthesis family protein [Burkholderia sp. Ax-1724]NIF75921.1 amino acid synthesis family protein [Paraburkholderia sp. Cy-641]